MNELDYWKSVFIPAFTDKYDILLHENIRGYTERQLRMAERTKNYDLVFEVHFNGYDGESQGSHAMYKRSSIMGKKLADMFTDQMSWMMGIEKDYNVPVSNSNCNGCGFVMLQKPEALLLEPFFGDNPDDVSKFDPGKFRIVIDETVKYFYENL